MKIENSNCASSSSMSEQTICASYPSISEQTICASYPSISEQTICASYPSISEKKICASYSSIKEQTIDFGIDKINALDLKKFRKEDLPTECYFLLLLPVIGWIAFACIHSYYREMRTNGEFIMNNNDYDSKSLTEKIAILKRASQRSGPFAWQYRLELIRVQLLNKDYDGANSTLKEVKKQRESGHFKLADANKIELISINKKHRFSENSIKIIHCTAEEALLNAVVHAANGNLAESYDSFNQLFYYDASLKGQFRNFQVELVNTLKRDGGLVTKRGLEIIKDETEFQARVKVFRN